MDSELLRPQEPWSSPVLRWAGSKRKLLPELLAATPTIFDRYIEPFAGSACLFFALNPPRALLGDFNAELVLAYRMIRAHPRRIARAVASLPRTPLHYYSMRNRNNGLSEFERAVRFIYLNRNCFNGVFRTNRLGEFNVPFGTHTGNVPTEAAFYRAHFALRKAKLIVGDFEVSLSRARKGDFVYLDPPYATAQKEEPGAYGYGAFEESDISRLIHALKRLDAAGATFLMSYSADRHFISACRKWYIRRVTVQRHVAGFAKNRAIAREILVTNARIW